MKSKITTIKISLDVKKRLENFRVYRRETYNDIIQKIFDILNICRLNPNEAKLRLMLIEKEKKRYFALKQNHKQEVNLDKIFLKTKLKLVKQI